MNSQIEVNDAVINVRSKGSGKTIVFIHGFSLSLDLWLEQVSYFSTSYRTIAYDLRGFGQSSCPQANVPYSHADDLFAILKHLNIDAAHILGLSLGGRVAVDFAIKYPLKVLSLTVADGVPNGFPRVADRASMSAELITIAREEGVNEAIQHWLNHAIFQKALLIPEVKQQLMQIVMKYSGWHWLNHDPGTYLTLDDADDSFRDIPTLCIVGEFDMRDYHNAADLLAEYMNNARKRIIQGAGHLTNMEKPEQFNQLFEEFISNT